MSQHKQLFKDRINERSVERRLEKAGILCDEVFVETSFGNTTIFTAGKTGSRSILIVFGNNNNAEYTLNIFSGLLDKYKLYVIDELQKPKKNETAPTFSNNSYGQWMFEVMASLNLKDSILIGISVGGIISLKALAFEDRFISNAFIITSTAINYNSQKEHYVKKNKGEEYINKLFYSDNTIIQAPSISIQQMAQIKTPIHLIIRKMNKKKTVLDAYKNLRSILPTLSQILVLEKSISLSNQSDIEQMQEFIISNLNN